MDAVDAERVGVGDPAYLVVLAVDVVHAGNLGRGNDSRCADEQICHEVSGWGASIKYVRKNLGIFDPLPPACPCLYYMEQAREMEVCGGDKL